MVENLGTDERPSIFHQFGSIKRGFVENARMLRWLDINRNVTLIAIATDPFSRSHCHAIVHVLKFVIGRRCGSFQLLSTRRSCLIGNDETWKERRFNGDVEATVSRFLSCA